jgi:hypothetical protein
MQSLLGECSHASQKQQALCVHIATPLCDKCTQVQYVSGQLMEGSIVQQGKRANPPPPLPSPHPAAHPHQ